MAKQGDLELLNDPVAQKLLSALHGRRGFIPVLLGADALIKLRRLFQWVNP